MPEREKSYEVPPALDKSTVFFLTGAVSEQILKVNEDPNESNLTDLRLFLSHLTLPHGETLENYLQNLGLKDHLAKIYQNKTNAGDLLGGLAAGIRSRDITWMDWEDEVLKEAMITPGEQLDGDNQCEVSFYQNEYYVRWLLPKPEVYWECEEPEKLIHVAIFALEEMIHMSQRHGDKFVLHSMGTEFDLSSPKSKEMQKFIVRMCELDVFNILSTAMPQMVEENWGWYRDRASKKTYDDHYPHNIDVSFMLGFAFSVAMDRGKEYLTETMISLPEFMDKNPDAREVFFSNHYVLGGIKQYYGWIYDSENITTKLNKQQIRMIYDHEFSRNGITAQFLIYCAKLKETYGDNWIEALDSGKFDPDGDTGTHGSDILNIILHFINEHPSEFNKISKKNNLLQKLLRSQKFKTADEMVDSFARSLK